MLFPGPVADAADPERPILQKKNADHKRAQPPAVINANDVCSPGDLASPSHSRWIKDERDLPAALRLAFLAHESRVKLASDEPHGEHARLVAVNDDHSRYAYVEQHRDQGGDTAAAVLGRAIEHFEALGVKAPEAVVSDDAFAYRRSNAFRAVLSAHGTRRILTPPYTPR